MDENKNNQQQNNDGANNQDKNTENNNQNNQGNYQNNQGKEQEQKVDIEALRKTILEEMGVENVEEVKSYAAKIKKEKEESMTEQEKMSSTLKQEQEAREKAEKLAQTAQAKVEALMLGAKPDCVDDVIALAVAKKNSSGNETDFKSCVSEVKAKYSYMFNDSSEENKKKEKGTGGNYRKQKEKEKEDENNTNSIGRKLAEKYAANKNKKSHYFSR